MHPALPLPRMGGDEPAPGAAMANSVGKMPEGSQVTRLVRRLREGDEEAFDHLFPLVYRRLRSMAHAQRTRWHGEPSLNTTALVHEVYIKLSGQESPHWKDRAHFLAVAATAMRQILIDHARSRNAQKRGGAELRVPLDEVRHLLGTHPGLTDERVEVLLALDESLERLRSESPRQYRIVVCRFFGGMTIPDTAEALGISPATVKRGWSMAQAWLYRDLKHSMRGAS